MCFTTDCKGTVDAANGLEQWVCRPSSARAGLWQRWFQAHGGNQVLKVKAHATLADVDRELITLWERAGNGWADHYAKLGAAAHRVPERARMEVRALGDLAQQACLATARMSLGLANCGLKDFEEVERVKPTAQRVTTLAVTGGPREVEAQGPALTGDGPARSEEELGPFVTPPWRLQEHSLEAASLFRDQAYVGSLLWCKVCGRYTTGRLKLIADRCSGKPPAKEARSAGQCLARIGRHQHPWADKSTKGVRLVGRRRAEEADVAALRLHVGAVQREVRRQAAALRALAEAPLPPTEEARMRIGRRAVLAAYGQTEA